MGEAARERFERLVSREVYACAWGYARRLAESRGAGRQDAEDLLQEALVRAWRGLSGLRDEAKFKGWLLAIIRRLHLTQRRLAAPATQPLDSLRTLAAPSLQPEQRATLEALQRLPPGPSELLSLFYLHGLTMQETAQVLGLAPGGIHMRLARARAQLRRELERIWPAVQPDAAMMEEKP
jgi:RNA polymerase sigma-70 factor (ECF subfamily)